MSKKIYVRSVVSINVYNIKHGFELIIIRVSFHKIALCFFLNELADVRLHKSEHQPLSRVEPNRCLLTYGGLSLAMVVAETLATSKNSA